jgi:hypothetical protein
MWAAYGYPLGVGLFPSRLNSQIAQPTRFFELFEEYDPEVKRVRKQREKEDAAEEYPD